MEHPFPRPKVLVSRCLGFAACRYDGQQLHSRIVAQLLNHVDFIDVCPEIEAGLGVPRPPIRLCLQDNKIEVWQPAESRCVTNALQKAAVFLAQDITNLDGAILKTKSPSCALQDAKIYNGTDKPQFLQRGSGIFGTLILEGLGHKAVEDEQRLTNRSLREHFLIKLFAWTRFRTIAVTPRMADLVDYHARHKLLFLAYNQKRFRLCGKIVANHERLPAKEVFHQYEQELGQILLKPFLSKAMINTLYHALGWVSEDLSSREKHFIINAIEEYRDERVSLQVVTRLIEAQAIRFNHEYLLGQVLLQPFPAQLSDLSDSGRGRELL
ncbi:MAG: DUF523 and DUF1722 domain-containing protein [Proteobacteria bacterium]|jgi:uncharacterized protein YbgA (DUF1722 family)/uncharacterized protein YbbK (DUF523 family)|nr:DUF523 and DUF1722 domain-containing protein [Desulfocapsa sp.]MBU3946199.1 DUF523 and DUF1722 domain-containing protein [Pseudomonadota bacterium]MCG2745211.1 DUF523 and DUF1722 domain-containing protein [Desulfobacteraceae bacterium]MBU3984540.1 DUF523 and DUF1722 domain-containing protein [Pseudomonadota bacterium]MBU4027822.1 DUF523 and DUF1722 domain-containing protein [Pseudomonadota bacterium]